MAQYELNVLDYWLIIKKRKLLILFTAALVFTFTFLMTQLMEEAPAYEASARVKYDKTSTFANLFVESFSYSWGDEWKTQSEVIQSFPVIERAAQDLGWVPRNASEAPRRAREYVESVNGLQSRISAKPEEGTSIIKITAVAMQPDEAEQMANAVADAYRAENIRARNRLVIESLRFVDVQLAERSEKLSQAEEALRDFKEREGRVFLAEEAKNALNSFTRLEEEYNEIVSRRTQSAQQIDILKKPGSRSAPVTERIFTENPTSILAHLNGRLVDLLQERTTLLVDYTTEHPAVQLVDRKVQNIKTEMLRELISKQKSLASKETLLKNQIERYRTRYLGFPKAAIQLTRLEREVKINEELYATLKKKQQELLVKSAERIEEVTVIAPAVASQVPMNAPNHQLNLMVGSVMGLFLGIVLAFTRESFDTSIGTIEGIEEFLKVPVLGVIPAYTDRDLREAAAKALPEDIDKEVLEMCSRLPCLVDPTSMLSENLRSLRTNLQFSDPERKIKTLLFTSVGLGEGKSTTIVNLALTLAQEGQRILLVDADLRKPTIHKRLGLKKEPGLADALVGIAPWKESVRTVTDVMLGKLGVDLVINSPGIDNLQILTSGTGSRSPAEFLNLGRITSVVTEMQEDYDLVLFDTPPILPVTDAVTISSRVDGTVLVYQVGRIGRSALRRAKFLLDHAQAHVLGVVLTNVRAEVTTDYSYSYYAYR